MAAPHIKLCIAFGSNVRRKNHGSHILNYISSSVLMIDAKMTALHIKLCIVFGSNVSRKKDRSTYLNYVSSSALIVKRRKKDGFRRKIDGSTY